MHVFHQGLQKKKAGQSSNVQTINLYSLNNNSNIIQRSLFTWTSKPVASVINTKSNVEAEKQRPEVKGNKEGNILSYQGW